MEKTKLTKREALISIKELVAERPELVEFCDHEIELLDRKNANRSTSSKMAGINEEIKNLLVEELAKIGKPVTISELLQNEVIREYTYEEAKEVKHITNQKVTAIFNKLVVAKELVKVADKKKVYFSIAE